MAYEFTIRNYGDVPLHDLTLTDDLDTQLAQGNPTSFVAVSSATMGGAGTLAANPAYDAAGTNVLEDGQSLAYSDTELVTETVYVVVTLQPGGALASGVLNLTNQAEVQGTSPGGQDVLDRSNEGTDPDVGQPNDDDPANDGDGDPTNNDGPTTVTLTENPQIGITKQLVSWENLGTGDYEIEFLFTVANLGDVNLTSVQVTDDLPVAFRTTDVTITALAADPPLTPKSDLLDALNSTELLDNGSSLDVGESADISMTLVITPGAEIYEGPFENSATASGDSPSDTQVEDVSTDVTDQDETDPQPDDEPTPTVIQLEENPLIGIAKGVAEEFDFGDGVEPNPRNLEDGTYEVAYVFTVVNYGDVVLDNITINDDLLNQLSEGNPVAVRTENGTLTGNPAYDGSGTANLLADGQSLDAAGSGGTERGTVYAVVTLVPGSALETGSLELENQAVVTGTSPGESTPDDGSNSGFDPDVGQPNGDNPDYDGDGDPTNNDGPTTVVLTEEPEIAVAKALSADPRNLEDGTYEIDFVFTVANTGDVDLHDVQLTDDLGSAFRGSPFTLTALSADAPLTAATVADAQATGALLVAADSTLDVGETARVRLTLQVEPGARIYDGPFENYADVTADSPADKEVSDRSNDGYEPEPGEESPTLIPLDEQPVIALAKNLNGYENVTTGVYRIDFTFTVANAGDVDLHDVQVYDDFAAAFRGSEFTLVSLSADGTLSANSLSNAQSTGLLLAAADSTLAVGQSARINVVLDVVPEHRIQDGAFENTALATATSPGELDVEDRSNDGLRPEPGLDVPTEILIIENPSLGVAKAAEVTPIGDGRYDVIFTFTIRNYGTAEEHAVEIRNLQLTDDLDEAFGAGNYRVQSVYSPTLATNSAAPDPTNPEAFDGSEHQNLLLGTDTLGVGESATVQLHVTVTPPAAGTYENLAHVGGTSPGGEPVEDTSTDGFDPDPDGDDDPTNNNDPTPVTFDENPLIGLAKNASVTTNIDGSFNIELTFTVRNMGDVPLHNVRIVDPLGGIYGITNLTADRISVGSSELTYNPGYDGRSDSEILAGTDSLPVGAERSITILLRDVRPTSGTSTTNSAVAHGESPTGTPTEDRSTDGFDPDPDGDGTPDEEVPTPIELERVTQIALAKRGALTIDSDGRTLTLEFTFNVANTGNVPLYGVRVSDDLAEYYANTDLSADMISVSSADLTVNPAFDGATDAHLLSGADSLAAGESGSITLTLAGFTANAGVTELANSALADGRGPDGTPTDDPSNDGDVPVPGEDVPTITPLTENPLLGVAKQAGVTVAADGTFTVTFDFVVGNYGNIELRDISLRDDLSVFWNAGLKEVSVSSDDFPVNSSFDGRTDTELLGAGATLAVGESGRLSLVLSGIDTPGNYTNQAIGEGESPTGTPTPPEYSSDGDDPDPNGDGTPDEDDPTPVTLESRPLLGLAKRATVLQNADLSYDVTFTIVVRNMGNAPLSGLQVTDDLSGFYADTDLSAADISVSSTDLSVNPGFNGLDDTALLTGTDTLAIGAESTVTIALAGIAPTAPVTLYNLAVGEGTPPGGEPVTDESTNGNNPDPNGDGDPAENEPTPVPLQPEPRIGIAKSAEVTSNADGSFDLVFSFVVGNYGNTELHNVQVRDDLSVFYGPTDISARHISLSSPDFTVNGGYDGLNDLRLLSGTDTLAIGESGTITMTITGLVISERVDTFNSAIATGTDPGGTPTPPDRSTDGDDPDPDGDGDPGNNNDPTPVVLGQQPLIGLAKAAETVSNGDGSYDITFTLLLRNYGEVPLFDLSLVDPLDEFYANTDLSAERVSVSSPTLAVNPAFDGASDTEVLAAGNSLAAGADATVTIVLSSVIPDAGVTALSNSALVSGTAPDGSTSSDISTDGDDPDPDGSGPGNHSDPTPVRFDELLAMLLDKEADPGPYQIGDRVSYTLTLINPTDTTQTVDLTDVTPAATEYISGTATIEPETLIPSEGSEPRQDEPGELSWRAIVLPPGETITVSYELRIRPGAESPLINTASIEGTGVSAQASASVLLEAGVFELERGLLIGRVYLDVNRNSRFDEGLDVPLPGARVVLANGWQTLTDEQGNYAFRDLESGTWAVMVDQLTTPYTPAAHPEQLRDPRQHRVQVQGVTVSDFPFESLAGLASTRRETTVSFGPIQLHKYHLPLGDTTRVVLEVTSADPWPPLLITDPLPGGGEREFTVELTGDEPVFLSYDLPAGVQLTDPSIEWSNR